MPHIRTIQSKQFKSREKYNSNVTYSLFNHLMIRPQNRKKKKTGDREHGRKNLKEIKFDFHFSFFLTDSDRK